MHLLLLVLAGRLAALMLASKMKMLTANDSLFKWLTLFIVPVLLLILVLNVAGWGTFLLDVAFALFVQIAIAVMLFGWLVVVVDNVKGFSRIAPLSQNMKLGIFLASAIVALPLIGIVFHRRVDIYDIVQTVFIVVAGLLFEPLERFFASPRIDHAPHRPLYGQAESTAGAASYANRALYQELLSKAAGDKDKVERLIEYERRRNPNLNQEESMTSAIERWEQDNR